MPPRVMTRSASRPAATSQGGGTGRRVGSEGKRVREPRRRNVEPTGKPNGQGNDQSVKVNEGMDGIHTWNREVAIGMSWDDLKVLMRLELCLSNEMQKLETKLWNRAMVKAGHDAYTDRFHKLASHRNGSIKKNPEKRGNDGEPTSGQLVEIDKVIRGCKLEIEGHVFDINLIPFGSGSFDVIIGMDWLSDHKAEIICHKKVVRITLLGGKVLRVLGERMEEEVRHLLSAKAKEKKQEEIVVVRDFPKVFPNDLSGLPPIREIKFRTELTPGAMPVLKFPYRLTPSELEELSGQLKEL
ncbi:putative reverse transcriptase domain-containing protein [Tanacetum coccineum]